MGGTQPVHVPLGTSNVPLGYSQCSPRRRLLDERHAPPPTLSSLYTYIKRAGQTPTVPAVSRRDQPPQQPFSTHKKDPSENGSNRPPGVSSVSFSLPACTPYRRTRERSPQRAYQSQPSLLPRRRRYRSPLTSRRDSRSPRSLRASYLEGS